MILTLEENILLGGFGLNPRPLIEQAKNLVNDRHRKEPCPSLSAANELLIPKLRSIVIHKLSKQSVTSMVGSTNVLEDDDHNFEYSLLVCLQIKYCIYRGRLCFVHSVGFIALGSQDRGTQVDVDVRGATKHISSCDKFQWAAISNEFGNC